MVARPRGALLALPTAVTLARLERMSNPRPGIAGLLVAGADGLVVRTDPA